MIHGEKTAQEAYCALYHIPCDLSFATFDGRFCPMGRDTEDAGPQCL